MPETRALEESVKNLTQALKLRINDRGPAIGIALKILIRNQSFYPDVVTTAPSTTPTWRRRWPPKGICDGCMQAPRLRLAGRDLPRRRDRLGVTIRRVGSASSREGRKMARSAGFRVLPGELFGPTSSAAISRNASRGGL
jgi:hypothetical protein